MQIYRKNSKAWSVFSAIIALIWASSAFSGVLGAFCETGTATAPAPADLASLLHASVDRHAQVCHCLSCPGGKKCCCLNSVPSTPAEQALLAARCSDEIPAQTVAVVAAKVVFPAAVVCPTVFFLRVPQSFPARPDKPFASLFGLPLLPPPRLS